MITKKLNERRKRKYEIRLRDRSQKVYLSEGNQKIVSSIEEAV